MKMTIPYFQQAVLEHGCEIGKAEKVAILADGREQTPEFMQENIVERLTLENIEYIVRH